jgi:hypothetical protein
LALLLPLLGACSGDLAGDMPPVPDGKLPVEARGDGIPALLTYTNIGAMEAIQSGSIVLRGPCLHLSGAPEEGVILWEEGTRIVRDPERGFAVELPDGLRVAVGDRIRGGGGALPTARPIAEFSAQDVPEECATGAAVQIHSAELIERVTMDDTEFRPPPPPPPPPAPSCLDSVKDSPEGSGAEPVEILGIDDPREALFAHMIAGLREGEGYYNRPACLRNLDGEMLARLSDRFTDVFAAPMCRWDGGGVVLREDDSPAVFVEARLDCDGRSRCAAEGARIFGNMGGEGQGYFMRPIPGGWSIEAAGVSWMS